MQGVTIIASEEVMKNPDWMFYVPVVLILLALMVAIISNIIDNDVVGMITVVLTIIFVFCGIFGFVYESLHNPNIYEYTKYYITVSDETPMLAFNEKYEVLEQHGDLWEVKENK